jgi:hypothetical protein
MIKHIVMWRVSGSSLAERKRTALLVKEKFEGLRHKIPGLRHLEVGLDISNVDYACDIVLYSEFESKQSLEAYASHPEHSRVKLELADCRIERYQVDYI